MTPFRRWAELPPELLCRIGDGLDLNCYVSARGACTAWRSALAPPSPSLLIVPDEARCFPSAASIPTRRAFRLRSIPWASGPQCVVGSSSGWLALSDQRIFSLFNPVTAAEIALPPLIHEPSKWVSKIVFAPNPARDDFAAAICGMNRIAYVTAGARRWAVLDPVRLACRGHLTDVVYHEDEGGKGTVYCLASYGDVHVLHLPERRCREPVMVMDDEPSPPPLPVIPIICRLEPIMDEVPSPINRRQQLSALARTDNERRRRTQQHREMIHMRSSGPDLNAPATVEPLLSFPFDPATCFAPPYNTVSGFARAKNLVFCEGKLYQIWRNSSCTVTVQLPGGGRHRVAENQVYALRYYPDRQPCWDAVTDLGGYSVFVGRNNAVSMYAEDVPGLKGNCVYWIGGKGRDQGMVFDMATGRSTPCLNAAAAKFAQQSTVCWYFLSDLVNINGGKRVFQSHARVLADQEKQDMEESPTVRISELN